MTRRKRICVAPADEIELEILHQLKGLEKSEKEIDEEDQYSRSVVATLRNMSSEQRALAKIKIQQVLYEIQYCMPPASLTGTYSPITPNNSF